VTRQLNTIGGVNDRFRQQFFSFISQGSIHFVEVRHMKLLVKVIEAEYSDAAQIAIVDMT
jgi:hypothetical protein